MEHQDDLARLMTPEQANHWQAKANQLRRSIEGYRRQRIGGDIPVIRLINPLIVIKQPIGVTGYHAGTSWRR